MHISPVFGITVLGRKKRIVIKNKGGDYPFLTPESAVSTNLEIRDGDVSKWWH